MKVKNKQTGEVADLFEFVVKDGRNFARFRDDKGTFKKEYKFFSDIEKEWDDYDN